jgi:hypothetical protein
VKRIIVCLLLFVGIQGCATPYQSSGFGGGFSETQIAPNAFIVRFSGNGFTSKERANDFTLLRSAQLALSKGYTHFAIVDSVSQMKRSTYTTPTKTTTYVNANTTVTPLTTYGTPVAYSAHTTGTARTVTTGGQTYNISKPKTENTIYCFTGKPKEFASFDAAYVVISIKEKYALD